MFPFRRIQGRAKVGKGGRTPGRSPESSTRTQSSRAWIPRARSALVTLGWCTALLGSALGAAVAVPALAARADTARPASRIEVRFVDAPSWMSPADLGPLEDLVRDELSGSPFDHDGLRIAADALRASGWFESISQIRRRSLDSVEVTGFWAEPAALVRDADGDHLIDTRGRLMPRSYLPGSAPAFPRIIGVRSPRPAVPGQRYGGDATAALALLRVLDGLPFRPQIAAVDLSRYPSDGTLSLLTSRDVRIHWGRPPDEARAAEVSTAQKIMYLQYLYDRDGRIDAVGQGEIDVTADYVGARP